MTDGSTTVRPAPTARPAVVDRDRPEGPGGPPTASMPPFLLDFFPLEDVQHTRLARFFSELKAGRLTTTRCDADDLFLWPPRLVCPRCHSEKLAWVELPRSGHIYAFSAVLAGAPLGMESEVPFVVGLVDLDGVPLRLFGRISGIPWDGCRIGLGVTVEPFDLPDGRVFYRFRANP